MSIKPWICNGSRTIVKDRWIDLHADDCALPDGTKISPFYVNDVPDFVVVVAVTVDGDFVFVRQYRNKVAAEFFNGGGHLNASGGEFYGTMDEAIDLFKQALVKYEELLLAKK